jgi:tetratricopeptide (TPR) repeat protein
MISGLYKEAIDAYNQAIELDPNVAGFYTMRGYCYAKLEEYRKALDDYTRAIELDPEDAQNYTLRGAVFGIIGEPGTYQGKYQGSGIYGGIGRHRRY